MGGHGGLKKKTVNTAKTATAAPTKPLRPKRAVPEPAEEASRPLKRQAMPSAQQKLPEHVLVSEEPSHSEPKRPADRKAAEAAKTRQIKREKFGLGKPAGPGSAVVYLGHIPHGFYEEQMKGFFSQFGTVSRLRLARNRKTGRSKHFAFIEFEHREVAEVVAKAMHGYLLYSKILECRVLKPEEVHAKTFSVRPVNPNRPIDQLRNSERKRFNQPRSAEQLEKLAGRRSAKARQRERQWAKAGIDYDFEGVSPAAKPTEKAAQKPKKVAPKAESSAEEPSPPARKKVLPKKARLKRAAGADKASAGTQKASGAKPWLGAGAKSAKPVKAA